MDNRFLFFWRYESFFNKSAGDVSETRAFTPSHFEFTLFTFMKDLVTPFDIQNSNEAQI